MQKSNFAKYCKKIAKAIFLQLTIAKNCEIGLMECISVRLERTSLKKEDNCSEKTMISGEQASGFVLTPNNTLIVLKYTHFSLRNSGY